MMLILNDSLPVALSMWKLQQPWWEFVLRAFLVYGFLLIILRLTGKRQVGQLAPFDLVLLLILSNSVQNSMNAGDNTVGAGFLLAGALVAVNSAVGYITYKSKKVEAFIDGKPHIIIHNGVADEALLTKERISHHELMAAVRQANLVDISEVHLAILETNGRINVVAKK
jgi:uncharacterized membrane protein YcaP (DUF421 family)